MARIELVEWPNCYMAKTAAGQMVSSVRTKISRCLYRSCRKIYI